MLEPNPLRVYLICPEEGLRRNCVEVFGQLERQAVLSHVAGAYPSGAELARTIRTFSPQVLLLSFERPETAVAVIRFLEAEAQGLPVIGLGAAPEAAVMREGLRAGTRDFLWGPLTAPQVGSALEAVRTLLARAPLSYTATDHIYSFLPSKPGVGATTVAINTAAALAAEPGLKVLLSDLDLTCGMIRFLLRLPQDLSIVDALARAQEMDVSLWPQLVTRREGFDVLHSGSINPQAYLDPPQMQGLIDFARCNYNALLFDLSGNLERHSLQVMQESKVIFLVCNPEPASMFLGREKLEFLRMLGVGERVAVIVNRANQALAVPVPRVAQFLGVPVAAALEDDTVDVQRSIRGGGSLLADRKSRDGELVRQLRRLGADLVGRGQGVGPAQGRKTRGAELAALPV